MLTLNKILGFIMLLAPNWGKAARMAGEEVAQRAIQQTGFFESEWVWIILGIIVVVFIVIWIIKS